MMVGYMTCRSSVSFRMQVTFCGVAKRYVVEVGDSN